MKASVIIPVYNAEPYLKECMESIIHQKTTYPYEIIAINDGSTDQSLSILKEYQDKIIIIDKQNSGPGDTRNLGISKAKGEYLFFVDSDDYIHEDMVQTMVDTLDREKADIVICDFYRVYENEVEIKQVGEPGIYDEKHLEEVLMMEFHSCNKALKRRLLIQNPYPKEILFEDVVAISKAILDAEKVVKLGIPLYYYRKREDSITNIINHTNYDLLEAMRLISPKFKQKGYDTVLEYLYVNNLIVDLGIKILKAKEKDALEKYKSLVSYVETKYPHWYQNPYLKKVKKQKKQYLRCVRFHLYPLIKIIIQSR